MGMAGQYYYDLFKNSAII